MTVENLVIIGSGPAGYTAAIYAARASLKPLVFEGFQVAGIPGGQLMTTTEVENFPGFPMGIGGPELMDKMRAQAVRWGAEVVTEDVIRVDFSQRPFTIESTTQTVQAHSVIIATGAGAKKLGLPNEKKFWSKGIATCAICDGASPLFRDKEVVIVGGGDSACEEAVYLTKFTTRVHMLLRGGEMRASKAMQDRVLSNPKIQVHRHTVALDAYGQHLLRGVMLQNTQTQEITDLPVAGLFYAIGHTPNTQLFVGQIDLDAQGYILPQGHTKATSVEGIFAAGDVQDQEYRQAITAAGTGCMAALEAERWLSAQGLSQEFKPVTPPEELAQEEVLTSVAAQTTEDNFTLDQTFYTGSYALRRLYYESDKLVVAKYMTPQCGPCHMLKPVLNAVVQEFAGQVQIVEIDIAAEPEIAQDAGVTGTPTLQFFKNTDMLDQISGVKQRRELRQTIQQYV